MTFTFDSRVILLGENRSQSLFGNIGLILPDPLQTFFCQDGGKSLQEGMEENTTIQTMDLRLTEVGQENEYCINQLLKRNREEKYRHSQTS